MGADAWPDADGVVEFPNGVRVRGRGLGRPTPPGPDPTVGVYLLGRPPPAVAWPSEWIEWPDFRLPSDRDRAVQVLRRVFADADAGAGRLEVACHGGRGRTGTALGVLAVASGVEPADAVEWVREHYHPKAIETPFQRRWVERLDR